MGALLLSEFRTDLQATLGNKGIDNPRLDRWINAAYHDLAGAVDFEATDTNATVATVASTQTITTPTGAMVVKLIKNTTTDNLLGWLPKNELLRRGITPTGVPLNWTRHATSIYLHPVPSGINNLFIIYKKAPTKLSAVGDVSVFPDMWDAAIFQLSVHHALLALGEDQRAASWLNRAVSYISSRMTEEELHSNASGLGASITTSPMTLQKRLQGEQAGLGAA